MLLVPSSAPACALENLINTGLRGEDTHQYCCGATLSQSELIHQNISVFLQFAVILTAPRNPPLRNKKQSNQSNYESINQLINRSLNQSVGHCWHFSVESVWGLSHRPSLWSLPESVWHHSLLPQANTHTPHTYIYINTHMLTDAHAESHASLQACALSPCRVKIWRNPDTIQQIKGRW